MTNADFGWDFNRCSAVDLLFGSNCLCNRVTSSNETQRLETHNTVLDRTNSEESGGLYYSDHTDIAAINGLLNVALAYDAKNGFE